LNYLQKRNWIRFFKELRHKSCHHNRVKTPIFLQSLNENASGYNDLPLLSSGLARMKRRLSQTSLPFKRDIIPTSRLQQSYSPLIIYMQYLMFAKCMYFEIYSIYTVHTEVKYYNMQKFMGDMSLLSLAECKSMQHAKNIVCYIGCKF
jgi:hypothetical protein